jgi:hypothetical protein
MLAGDIFDHGEAADGEFAKAVGQIDALGATVFGVPRRVPQAAGSHP